MNLTNLRNSVYHIVNAGEDVATTTNYIMSLFFVEMWPYVHGDKIGLDALDHEQFSMLVSWVRMNRGSYTDGHMRFVKDMREVFPGLTVESCVKLVKGV